MGEKTHLLDHISDASSEPDRIPIPSGTTFDVDLAAARIEQAVDQLERGCLSAAAPPQQDKGLAPMNFQVQVGEHPVPEYGVRDLNKLDGCARHRIQVAGYRLRVGGRKFDVGTSERRTSQEAAHR